MTHIEQIDQCLRIRRYRKEMRAMRWRILKMAAAGRSADRAMLEFSLALLRIRYCAGNE